MDLERLKLSKSGKTKKSRGKVRNEGFVICLKQKISEKKP